MNKKQGRWLKRQMKFMEGRENEIGAGGKAALRRRIQMVKGQLKAENGVVILTESQLEEQQNALRKKLEESDAQG